jgi:hypothetical protein
MIDKAQFIHLAQSEILGNEKCWMFLRRDNILQINLDKNVHIDLEEALFFLNVLEKLSAGNKYPLLAIYSEFNSFSPVALDLVTHHKITTADALVIKSDLLMRIIATYYSESPSLLRPTKIFNDEDSALAWLKQF